MTKTPVVVSRADELRRAFDLSFAAPPPLASEEVEDLVAIRVAGDPYAIRLREIAGMVVGRTVVAVPTVTRDLVGLAGIRGGVVAVFGLASILGYTQAESPRWLLLCDAEEPIALAFSDFEGHVRLPRSSLHADENPRGKRQHVSEVASTEAGTRPVISIPLIVATIRNRSGTEWSPKEQ